MKLKESYRNRRVAIKTDCHRLIDEMVSNGANRAAIYVRLAKKLNMPPGRTHFAKIDDIDTLQRAFGILDAQARGWRNKKPKPARIISKTALPPPQLPPPAFFQRLAGWLARIVKYPHRH